MVFLHAFSVIVLLCSSSQAAADRSDGSGVLKRLQITERRITLEDEQSVLKVLDPEEWARRRAGCDYKETCVEWAEDCMEFTDECTGGWYTECTGGWQEECTQFAQQCSQGWRNECTRTSQECSGGWDTECTRSTKNCNSWLPWPLSYLCDGWSWVCTNSKVVCKGWETVCTASSEVCNGFQTVCKASKHVCEGFSDICEGGTHAVCTTWGETCKASATVCQVGEDVVEAVVDAVENFVECLEDNFSDGTLFFDADDCGKDSPLQNAACYARAKGAFITDGFEAGCPIPELKFGVEFGSVDDDKDTAQYLISIGQWEMEVPALEKQWTESSVKDFVYVNADIGFSWINDAKLDVSGGNFDLTLPGLKWDFEASLGMTAEHSKDPCADDIYKCRIILNKGKTTLFRRAFAAGPIPVVIEMGAEVYLGTYPKINGKIAAGVKVFFEDDGVTLMNSITLPLDEGIDAVVRSMNNWVNGNQIKNEMQNKIRVEVSGSLEASASLDVCIGVVFSFHINGVGSEVDIPLCLNAALDVAGNANLQGAELQVDASISITPVELAFVFDLPDISAAVDTACGFVQAPLAHTQQLQSCVPIVGCFSDLVDDTCSGVSDAFSALDLQIELATLQIVPEIVLWSKSIKLQTDVSSTDLAQTGFGQDHVKPRAKGVGLANDVFHDVPAERLGNWGFGDFSVSFTWRGTGGALTPDGEYGAIFIKSGQLGYPYTGPSAFLWDDGRIQFRVRGDDVMSCPAGTLPNPTSTQPRALKFSRTNKVLRVFVDGRQKCSRTTTLEPDLALFRNAPLRFGANHGNPIYQNLNAELSNFEFESGNDAIGHYTHVRKECVDGMELAKYYGKTITECSVLCDNHSKCVAFNFAPQHGSCLLKSDAKSVDCAGWGQPRWGSGQKYIGGGYSTKEKCYEKCLQHKNARACGWKQPYKDCWWFPDTGYKAGNTDYAGQYNNHFVRDISFDLYVKTAVVFERKEPIRLADNVYEDIPAKRLGSFGRDDFTVEFTWKGTGAHLSPDTSYGALFIRTGTNRPNGAPYTGPSAFLWDDGRIQFRLRSDDKLDCPAGTLSHPTSTTARKLKFSYLGGKLQVDVDGKVKCTRRTTLLPDLTLYRNAPLRFGGNHGNPNYQNLNGQISNLLLTEGWNNVDVFWQRSEEVTLGNNKVFEVPASKLGTFGTGDFAVELTWKGKGGHLSPDTSYGALFLRSAKMGYPYTGPSAFVWDDGKIQFRLRGDDKMDCPAGTLSNPTSSQKRRLKFVHAGGRLSVLVDNVVKCSRKVSLVAGYNDFKTAPLRFGGNHGNKDYQNLHVALSDIVLYKGADNLDAVWKTSKVDLANNKHYDIPATTLGTFGAGDFSVDLTWAGKGGHLTPDGTYGSLFIRSGQMGYPYSGPSAFIWDNGAVQFRLRGDDKMDCPAGTLSNPTSKTERKMKFLHADGQLKVFVDGVLKCSRTVTKVPDVNLFKNAPFRFGGNHGTTTYQNLYATVTDVVLRTTHF